MTKIMIMIIRNLVTRTLKASTLNSRGYAVPPDRWIQTASTLKGSPVLMGDYHDEWMGDPFRVDVPPVVLSAGRSDLRLLSVDAFSVLVPDSLPALSGNCGSS